MRLLCDVSRLLQRYEDQLLHTGVDRVNLNYAKWVIGAGGGLCIQKGHRLENVSEGAGKTWMTDTVSLKQGVLEKGNAGRINQLRKLFSSLANLPSGEEIPTETTILNTSHAWLGRHDVWDWLKKRHNRVFTFIHDLIPIEFPEYARPDEKLKHVHRINNALLYSAGIMVNSKCTEESLRKHAERVKLNLPPVLVAPLGHTLAAESEDRVLEGMRSPYFLFIGTIEPRKNHLLILTVWRELVRRLGPATPQLVVVGRRGWECEQIIDLLDRCDALRPYVREYNEASDEEVASLVRGARAVLLPSFAEGFGMPVQEALAAGTPVIASPLPPFLEMAGEIPDYAEPFDGVRWLHLIMNYAEAESSLRKLQLERLRGFRETTWDAHFKKFDCFLREASQ